MAGNAGVQNDLDREISIAADRVFPAEYQTYGKSHLKACLRMITAASEYTSQGDALTPFTLHKLGDYLRTSLLPELEPYSVNRAGFVNQRYPVIIDEFDNQNLTRTSPSEIEKLQEKVIACADWVPEQLSISDTLIHEVQHFLDTIDPRQFFEKHDKTKVYPRVTDENRYIQVDENLLRQLKNNCGQVDDPRLSELVNKSKTEVWEVDCDDTLRPILQSTYNISKHFKNLYISDEITDLSHETDKEYIRRKLNIRPLQRQFNESIVGEVVWLNGMLSANAMSAKDALEGAWQFVEYPGGEPIRIEFDAELDNPEHQLFNYSLGIVGPVQNRHGSPVVKAAGIIKNGELPESLTDSQSRALNRLGYQLDQHIISNQNDIESVLRTILEKGDLSQDEQWLIFDILDQIDNLKAVHDIIEQIASHEQADRIFKIILDNIEYIQV